MPVVDTKFELCHDVEFVLKIGRDYQNKDGFRGAHYDTVKLLCDTIEYLRDKLPKPNTDRKDICAKLREALEFSIRQMSNAICDNTFGDDVVYLVGCMKTCIDRMKSALAAPPTISEEYAKPKLCKSCAHYMTDGCEICGCTDYKECKGESDESK